MVRDEDVEVLTRSYKYSSEYPRNLVVLIVDSSIPSPACVSGLQLPPSLRSAACQLGEQRATLASLDAHIYAGPWWHHRSSVVLPGLWPLPSLWFLLDMVRTQQSHLEPPFLPPSVHRWKTPQHISVHRVCIIFWLRFSEDRRQKTYFRGVTLTFLCLSGPL